MAKTDVSPASIQGKTSQVEVKSGGTFAAGFSVGVFAGVVGYYLFGTRQGKQVRSKVTSEWDRAKARLKEEGIWDNPDVSLREIVEQFASKMSSAVTPSSSKATKKKSPSQTRSGLKKASRPTAKPTQFKGAKS